MTPTRLEYGPEVVWTLQNGTALFIALSDALDSNDLKSARATLEMRENSGNCKITAAYQYSNDGITWDAHQTFGTAQVGNGTTYGSYADISANAKRLIRFGLVVEQDQASGTIQMCHAWLEIDVKGH
jgi:hypothetical protein